MKHLTQAEFDALPNNRPIDARVDGVPPDGTSVLLWDDEWVPVERHDLDWYEKITDSGWRFDRYPIYHKLPDDYVDGE